MWPVLADERPVGVMIQVTETAQFHEKTLAMNEALMLGSVRQHELTEAANSWNARLQAEIIERTQAEAALRAAREELAQANAELEQKVRERTAKLQETVAELEHFSYTITHDMRAPLRAMHGLGGILLEECSECLHPTRREYLRRIADSADRMDKLITDALQYSGVVRQHLELEPVDAGALLRGILESYPQFQPPHANIHIDSHLPVVLGNKAGLTQCFSNLLGQRRQIRPPRPNPRSPRLGRKSKVRQPKAQTGTQRASNTSTSTLNPQPSTVGPHLVRRQRHRHRKAIPRQNLGDVPTAQQELRRHRHRPRPGAQGGRPHGRQSRRRVRTRPRQPLLGRTEAGQRPASAKPLTPDRPSYALAQRRHPLR